MGARLDLSSALRTTAATAIAAALTLLSPGAAPFVRVSRGEASIAARVAGADGTACEADARSLEVRRSDESRGWILVPARPLGAVGRAAVARWPEVARVEPVFGASERAWLRARGETALADTLTVTPRDPAAAYALAARLRAALPGARLEPNLAARPARAADPLERLQWGLRNRGAPQGIPFDDYTTLPIPGVAGEDIGVARLPETGSPAPLAPVVVAVLDTGIDWEHPEFAGRLARREAECAAYARHQACVKAAEPLRRQDAARHRAELARCDAESAFEDRDGNGYPMDCLGWNFTTAVNPRIDLKGDPHTQDSIGHGTHVAGVIAAGRNGFGVAGVAPEARLLPVKVVDSSPNNPIQPQALGSPERPPLPDPRESALRLPTGSRAFADSVARGMLYALRSGAQVINLSLAWPPAADSVMMARLTALARSRGVTVVAAAGNDSTDARVLPCRYDGVICVGAHGPDGAFGYFSNHGGFVDLLAPGTRILSTWPLARRQQLYTERRGYEYKNGTSMAAPAVAGAVAELLARGHSPDEAYARLMASARPVRAGELRPANLPAKHARSGNLDLARAVALAPEPLLLPAEKSILRLDWDRQAGRLPLRLRLRDFWAPAARVSVRARLERPDGAEALGARLVTTEWDEADWAAGEIRELATEIEILSTDVDGRLTVALRIEAPPASPRELRVPLELSIPVGAGLALPGMRALPLRGYRLPPAAELRTVKNLVPGPVDYLALERLRDEFGLTLLRESADGTAYDAAAARRFSVPRGTFLEAHRLHQDGRPTYVVITQLPAADGARPPRPRIRFDYLDESLRTLETLEHDGATGSLFPESLNWHRVNGKLRPAWAGPGLTPPRERPAFDPWETDAVDRPRARFYFLDAGGVRSVALPDDTVLAQILVPTESERRAGEARVLLARGTGYRQSYFVVRLREGRLADERPVRADEFRQLLGAPTPLAIQPLRPVDGSGLVHRATGSAFAIAAMPGTLRGTSLFEDADGPRLSHALVRPPALTESVRRLVGAWSESPAAPAPVALFAESHFELVYRDLARDEEAVTTLGRFSFIPAAMFGKIFTPAVAENARGERLPAVLIPADLGDWEGAEVIVPDYDEASGRLRALARPAKSRLRPAPGCAAIGNPIEPSSELPSQVVFNCGDRLIRVPLLK